MIGFGQMANIEHTYYYPHQDNGIYNNAKFDGMINHIIHFNYTPSSKADSVYAVGSGSMSGIYAYGSIQYHSNNLLNDWSDDIGPGIGNYTTQLIYNSADHVIKADCYSISIFGNAGRTDSLFYNSSNQLICKKRYDYFNLSPIYIKNFNYNLIGQITQMNYISNNTIFQKDSLIYNPNGDLIEVYIDDGRTYKYYYNLSNNLCSYISLYFNGTPIDTVAQYSFNLSGQLESYNFKEYSFVNPTPIPLNDDDFDDETYIFIYDIYGRLEQEKWYETNGDLGHTLYYYYDNIPSSIEEHSSNKELLKITDLLGRETKQTNQPLFYIYDDGTVEKRIVIE